MTELKFDFQAVSIDPASPLIYLWEVFDAAGDLRYCYVGKAKKGDGRPRKHYKRNVKNLLRGGHYRKGKPDGFRVVHHELANAVQSGHRVVLTLIRNVLPGENIDVIEKEERLRRACM
jgi:hypothetical protein